MREVHYVKSGFILRYIKLWRYVERDIGFGAKIRVRLWARFRVRHLVVHGEMSFFVRDIVGIPCYVIAAGSDNS